MALIDIEDVKKVYHLGKTEINALRGLTFSVEEGEFLSIMGPSGCGKTTLLNIIGCIDRPSSGRVFLDGEAVDALTDNQEASIRLEKMGFIFQSFNLIPVLNVRENVGFPLMLKKVPPKERRRRVDELVEMVGLSPFADHKPDELSGGQRQRVAIARALANRPRLVIADEPTANLDSETSASILSSMKELNEKERVTFIFSTHDPDIMKYAGRRIHLKDGLLEREVK